MSSITLGKQADLFAIYVAWWECAPFISHWQHHSKGRSGEHFPHSRELGFVVTSTFNYSLNVWYEPISEFWLETWKQASLTGAGGLRGISVWAVVTISAGANTGCSWAGTAVSWTGLAETFSLFGLEAARAASWWEIREKNSIRFGLQM